MRSPCAGPSGCWRWAPGTADRPRCWCGSRHRCGASSARATWRRRHGPASPERAPPAPRDGGRRRQRGPPRARSARRDRRSRGLSLGTRDSVRSARRSGPAGAAAGPRRRRGGRPVREAGTGHPERTNISLRLFSDTSTRCEPLRPHRGPGRGNHSASMPRPRSTVGRSRGDPVTATKSAS
jgi:hypothetical protein